MGFWDWLGFGKHGDKAKERAQAIINSVELQNEMMNQNKMIKSLGLEKQFKAGGTLNQLPNAYGEFGREPTNPIPVNGSYGEVTYLSRLRVKDSGSIVVFHRAGSYGANKVCAHPVDGFEIVSLDGTFKDKLFFDMYHDGQSSKIPDGYTMIEKLDGLTGVPNRLNGFPDGIYDTVARYSEKVFGASLALPELRAVRVEKCQAPKEKNKKGNYRYNIDRPAESREYLECWSVAGKYLEVMFRRSEQPLPDPHMGFSWLRTDIISPTFDSMNFRYRNKVFSVLFELVVQVEEDAFITKTARKEKELQVKICKENDMIPCLFMVDVNKMRPVKGGWNLRNTETGEIVIPTDEADDSLRPVSAWELMNWGISIVLDDLRLKGYKVLSFTDAPGVMPQIWFEDSKGNKCWIEVVVNKPTEIADFSGTIAEKYKGYIAGVMIQPIEGGVLYRSHPANIKYKGLQEV